MRIAAGRFHERLFLPFAALDGFLALCEAVFADFALDRERKIFSNSLGISALWRCLVFMFHIMPWNMERAKGICESFA